MRYIHIIVFLLLLFLGGCSKDKEFVKQDLFEDFAVKYPQDTTFQVSQYDTLKISPTISGMDEKKAYSYEWKVYIDEGKTKILSTDRNLVEEISLPEGTYILQLSVKETSSGVATLSHVMNLNVTGKYYEGWFVTNNINNEGRMSFLRSDGEIILDPLKEANGKEYSGKAVGTISVIADGFYNNYVNQIMYFTDKGLTMFDPASLLQITETNQNLFSPISFSARPFFALNSYTTDQYFIGNGGLYAAYIPFSADEAGKVEMFSSRFAGDYNLFPFIFPDSRGNSFVYDNKGKRFYLAEYYGRVLYEDKEVGKTMLGADITKSSAFLALLKGTAGYSIATCTMTSVGTSQVSEVAFTPIAIDDAPVFAASSEFAIGYFSAGNKLYSVNASNGIVTLIYTFSSGSTIGDIQMIKEGTEANRKLVVAVNNGDNGEVYYLYLGSQGDIDSSKTPQVFKNFGNIVQLNYRTAS